MATGRHRKLALEPRASVNCLFSAVLPWINQVKLVLSMSHIAHTHSLTIARFCCSE
ncbi:hypothetical protein MPC4_220029 [Methylocella tundrae]|uniref:Uncharacterized protein n=1 Tax=Methylocella tundrae TaxID=227605 RepID=A0A8B6M7B3_METTU|nr:hypothetical protein MPC1_200002 [Methylocella tundrae]VTZ50299.1 hypothetical protein MPC4_220029 [Methylocella tundrae]